MEKSDLLDAYFGVAKCYLIIEDELEKFVEDFSSLKNKKTEYEKILEDKDILTEAEFALKNSKKLFIIFLIFLMHLDYQTPTEGKKIIKTTIKMTIMKNQNFKCLRCNFQRCSQQNKICSTCKYILKDEI